MSFVLRPGPFLNELCVEAWPFFEVILYSSRVNTWPGPFLKQLCIAAWPFFEGIYIRVELIHGLGLF